MKYTLIFVIFLITMISCQGNDYFNLGVFQSKNGNYEKSIYFFTKAIEKNPNDNEAYYNRAYSQQKIGGKEQNVILDYSKSLEFNPNDFEAYNNRGVAYKKVKEYKKALSDFKMTIKLNPEYSLAFYNIGNLYALMKNKDSACVNFNKALNLGYKDDNINLKIKVNCK